MDRAQHENEWLRHKETIRMLYLSEDKKLEGPGGVIETMANVHSFKAS